MLQILGKRKKEKGKRKKKKEKKRKKKKEKKKTKKKKKSTSHSAVPCGSSRFTLYSTNLLPHGSTAWAASRPQRTRLGQGIQLRNEVWGPDIRIVLRGIFPDLLCHFAGFVFSLSLRPSQADTLISKRIIVHVGFFF